MSPKPFVSKRGSGSLKITLGHPNTPIQFLIIDRTIAEDCEIELTFPSFFTSKPFILSKTDILLKASLIFSTSTFPQKKKSIMTTSLKVVAIGNATGLLNGEGPVILVLSCSLQCSRASS